MKILFQVGDLIIYGSEGVCKVVGIGVPEIFEDEGGDREYYTLEPLYRRGTVYTPVDTSVFMRHVISREEALDLINVIPDIDDEIIENRNIRMLSEQYEQSIRSHSCTDLVRLIKSVDHKRRVMNERGKKLGQVDEKFFKRAEELLHGEFAVALDIPKEEVRDFISDRVKKLINE